MLAGMKFSITGTQNSHGMGYVQYRVYWVHTYIGGAERTFACKIQECLWQDWYISCWTLFDISLTFIFTSNQCEDRESRPVTDKTNRVIKSPLI